MRVYACWRRSWAMAMRRARAEAASALGEMGCVHAEAAHARARIPCHPTEQERGEGQAGAGRSPWRRRWPWLRLACSSFRGWRTCTVRGKERQSESRAGAAKAAAAQATSGRPQRIPMRVQACWEAAQLAMGMRRAPAEARDAALVAHLGAAAARACALLALAVCGCA